MKRALWLAALSLCATGARAREEQSLNVRYETRSGPSPWQGTTVSFLTGYELNTLTNSINAYGFDATYAVVFFRQGQLAVIRLDGLTNCLSIAQNRCAWGVNSPAFTILTGHDQEGRQWDFCSPQNFECR